jgi:holo-[acyl-carrier protein] synthase
MEVVRDAHGDPSLEVRGAVAAVAAERGVTRIHLSMSHDAGLATAFVVAEGEDA